MTGRVVIALALAACSHHAHPAGEEWLHAIEFHGNHAMSRSSLLDGLALHRTLKAQHAPDPYLVQVDADRLRGQYVRAGYFDVDVQASVQREGDATTVIYTIHEGTRATTRVEITGLPEDPALPVGKVREVLPLADGAPFDYDKYDAAKPKLIGVLQDAGYAHARLDADVQGDSATHTATVRLVFTPGPKCTFGKVTVQGVDGDLRQAVLDRMHFAEGDTFSAAALAATQRDIYGMARFSTVQVQPDAGEGAVVAVKIAVSESARHELVFGGGFGADPISYEVRGRAGYTISAWPVPLDTLTLDFRPAYAYLRDGSGYEPRIRAVARLDRMDLLLTHATGSIEIGYNYLAYEAYTEYGPEARLGYELPLGTDKLKLRAGWKLESYGFRDVNPLIDTGLQAQIGIDHGERIGAFVQSLILDLRDSPIEPHLGLYAELLAAEGTPYAGSAYTYQQVTPELRGYVPIGIGVLAARARYGAIFGDVPPTERYYAGGAASNRGFAERELSPSVTGPYMGSTVTIPYGGGGLIDSSIEARIPFWHVRKMPLAGVVFLDGGDVTDRPGQLDLGHLNWAAGVGLRLITVVGPVRADVGYRLDRTGPEDPEPGSVWAFHISLGEAF
ncbi:MAG TPA: BamA/TamA family outer membrane protein [Kofleriaceae bacterium]|nr:BamA/TamA family outer membrane protein [Kofleriaceae bacterium]